VEETEDGPLLRWKAAGLVERGEEGWKKRLASRLAETDEGPSLGWKATG